MLPEGEQGQDDDTPRVTALVGRLVGDAREMASAEVDLFRARIIARLAKVRNAAIFFAAAGVLALSGLIALLVGLILTIAPMVGAGIATAIVIGTVLLLAAVLALLGKSALSAGKDAA